MQMTGDLVASQNTDAGIANTMPTISGQFIVSDSGIGGQPFEEQEQGSHCHFTDYKFLSIPVR
jgi:hypothetical protein